jgi:hypothetical protein
MVAVPIKWKAMALQEKLNIMQKMEANLDDPCSDVCAIFIQILGDPL